jgi:hypothetical protein
VLLEDVFQRWRVGLESSQEAVGELEALLRSPETCSAKQQCGEVTRDILHAEFWRDVARLEVDTDANDGADHIRVDYPVYVHLSDGPAVFLVRAADVKRWEHSYYPMTAAPPPRAAKGPVRGEIDRFGDADRALFPEIKRLMKSQRLTSTEAVRQIPDDKLAGRGTLDSRIRRVSDRFRREEL